MSLSGRTNTFDFTTVSGLSSGLVNYLKLSVLDILEKQSFSHGYNSWGRFIEFYRAACFENGSVASFIHMEHLLNFRASLNGATVWKLAVVRGLLERATQLGYPVATPEALAYLQDAVIPGNPKGDDVRTADPRRGAFKAIELENLNKVLNEGYIDGTVGLADYTLCHLILAFGARAKQIASIKACDLIVTAGRDGTKVFTLRIPRAKQRGEVARDSFTARPCDARLGALIERLYSHNAGLGIGAADPMEPGDLPLFVSPKRGDVPGFAYHRTATEIGARIQQTFEGLLPIHANSKRFRHTLAKRAYDNGANAFIIAQLLDQSDTQNVKIYTEGGPDIIERLNRTMAMELAPIAQAFAGLLVSRDDPEARDAEAAKRIHDRALPDGKGADPLGSCGLHGFCGQTRPVACYTCRNFRPWDDGPHGEILDGLLRHRERAEAEGKAPRIFGLHDRTILAVARVVQLCLERGGPTGPASP